MAKQPFPLDRGWAWAIVFGTFLGNLMIVGITKSLGMFLTEFQNYFGISTSLASMVIGGSSIVYTLFGPVAILLGKLFSVRQVMVVGAVVAVVGMSLGSLLFSIHYVIVTFGVCMGVCNATAYGNSLVMVGVYFNKRRALAMGIAVAGASVGQLVLPPLIKFLLDFYGLQGCLLLISALYFHVIIAAVLFRPPSYWVPPGDSTSFSPSSLPPPEKLTECRDSGKAGVRGGNQVTHLRADDLAADDSFNVTVDGLENGSASSFHPADVRSYKSPPDLGSSNRDLAKTTSDGAQDSVRYQQLVCARKDSHTVDISPQKGAAQVSDGYAERGAVDDDGSGRDDMCLQHGADSPLLGPRSTSADTDNTQAGRQHSDHCQTAGDIGTVSDTLVTAQRLTAPQMDLGVTFKDSSPKSSAPVESTLTYRSHMASNGSLCQRPHSAYGSSLFLEPHDMAMEDLEWPERKAGDGSCGKLKTLFDCTVMKSYIAVFIVLYCSLSFFGFFNFILFLPAAAEMRGISKYNNALLVSVCGIGDLVGRLVTAAFGDRDWIARYKVKAVAILGIGVSIGGFILADSLDWMLAFSALYGFTGGLFISLSVVVIIDFVGLEDMPRVLAFVLLLQGLGASLGQPLLGALRDVTGSFLAVLSVCTLSCVMGGLLLFSYPLVLKLEHRRIKHLHLPPQLP